MDPIDYKIFDDLEPLIPEKEWERLSRSIMRDIEEERCIRESEIQVKRVAAIQVEAESEMIEIDQVVAAADRQGKNDLGDNEVAISTILIPQGPDEQIGSAMQDGKVNQLDQPNDDQLADGGGDQSEQNPKKCRGRPGRKKFVLPRGWKKEVRVRESGDSEGHKDTVYVERSTGYVFRSQVEVKEYLETGKRRKRGRNPGNSN